MTEQPWRLGSPGGPEALSQGEISGAPATPEPGDLRGPPVTFDPPPPVESSIDVDALMAPRFHFSLAELAPELAVALHTDVVDPPTVVVPSTSLAAQKAMKEKHQFRNQPRPRVPDVRNRSSSLGEDRSRGARADVVSLRGAGNHCCGTFLVQPFASPGLRRQGLRKLRKSSDIQAERKVAAEKLSRTRLLK